MSFYSISTAQVRQKIGRPHSNVGELSPFGVMQLIQGSLLAHDDIFTNIGSGIGNVVAQVALQTDTKTCFGVEMYLDIANTGRELINNAISTYPRLSKVQVVVADVREL